jgi:hypothetical protein
VYIVRTISGFRAHGSGHVLRQLVRLHLNVAWLWDGGEPGERGEVPNPLSIRVFGGGGVRWGGWWGAVFNAMSGGLVVVAVAKGQVSHDFHAARVISD